MKQGNWIAIDKNIIYHFKKPFSKCEALVSLSIDRDNNTSKSVREYARIFGWYRKKVERFLAEINEDKSEPQMKTGLRLIIKDLSNEDEPQMKTKVSHYYKPNNNKRTKTLCNFDEIWSLYPAQKGKKLALKHFNASVKTQQDFDDINTALKNYINSDRVKRGYIQNGSTWFNNWRDWINHKDTPKYDDMTIEQKQREKTGGLVY